MDISTYLEQPRYWWLSLPYDTQYNIWLTVGAALLLLAGVASYYLMRHLLGYRKFRGAWLSEHEFRDLVDALMREQKESNRVLHYDEMKLVMRALHGPRYKPLHKSRYGGYA